MGINVKKLCGQDVAGDRTDLCPAGFGPSLLRADRFRLDLTIESDFITNLPALLHTLFRSRKSACKLYQAGPSLVDFRQLFPLGRMSSILILKVSFGLPRLP